MWLRIVQVRLSDLMLEFKKINKYVYVRVLATCSHLETSYINCFCRWSYMFSHGGFVLCSVQRGCSESLWDATKPDSPWSIQPSLEVCHHTGACSTGRRGTQSILHRMRQGLNLLHYPAHPCSWEYWFQQTNNAEALLKPSFICPYTHIWNICLHFQNILKLDCCIGIIGGKPKHSLYFIGFQGENQKQENGKGMS